MAKHKLLLEDVFEDVSFNLIAIHCTLVDYRLAYLLNRALAIRLYRKQDDLDYNDASVSFSIFEWQDKTHQVTWNLVTNTCRRESEALSGKGSLFSNEGKSTRTYHLIPEFKKVDYFLKICSEGEFINEKTILNNIQKIPEIITAYSVESAVLKSKNNLIFS